MKPLVEHMAFYEAYHKHPMNKLTHVIGIPMIIYSILVPMSWLAIQVAGVPVNLAMIFVAVVLVYYACHDAALAAGMALFMIPAIYLAWLTAQQPMLTGLIYFAAFFIVGWIFQILGHSVFEKRRPALVDNLFQLVVGPVFILAEGFYLIGLKHDLRDRVKEIEAENRRREAEQKT